MHALSLGNRAVLLKPQARPLSAQAYKLMLACLAAAPRISIGRTVTKTVKNEFIMQAKFVLSQTAHCYLLIRAILQEINGE